MLIAEFLRLKQIPFLVFLAGEEDYFKREGVEFIRSRLPGAQVIGFGGPDEKPVSWPVLHDEWNSRELFGGEKLIVVSEEGKLFSSLAAPLRTAAASYRGKNRLVFLLSRKEALKDGTPPWTSLAAVVECRKLYDRSPPWKRGGSPWESELTGWIREQAASSRKKISWDDAWLLAEQAGTDPGCLARELEKLALFAGERSEITREDIQAVSSSAASPPVFRVLEMAGMRKYVEARKYCREWLATQDGSPLALLSQLINHYARLWRGVMVWREGLSRERVAQECKVPPFLLDLFLAQVAVHREIPFFPVWEALAEADRRLKGSAGTPEEIYEQLFLALEQRRRENGTRGRLAKAF